METLRNLAIILGLSVAACPLPVDKPIETPQIEHIGKVVSECFPFLDCYSEPIAESTEATEKEQRRIRAQCTKEITPKHTRKQIEDIVRAENTPKEAFERVSEDIIFKSCNREETLDGEITFPGKAAPCLRDWFRWYSMQEIYALGKGFCPGGAITCIAMLSDNLKYEAKIVSLIDHMIAVFKENDKWGYASFNDIRGKKNKSYFCPAKYNSINEMIYGDFPRAIEYMTIELTPEQMKFGKAIIGWEEKSRPSAKWHIVRIPQKGL